MIYPIEVKGKTKKQVTKLNLSGLGLTAFPENIFEYTNLTKLVLCNNKIKTIPKEIQCLKKLEVLDLANNEIKVLHSVVFHMPKMRVLNVYGNQIKKLPKQVSESTLQKIILGKNPIEMSELTKLPEKCKFVGVKLDILSVKDTKEVNNLDAKKNEDSQNNNSIMEQKHSVFISYSHEDKKWLKKVQTSLNTLKKYYKNIDTWSDEKIMASDVWKDEISNALESATIAILLVSPDFIASDFIANEELQPILNKAKVEGTRILALILRPTPMLEESGILKYQAVNDPKKPLSGLQDADQEWVLVEMVNTIKKILTVDKK